MVSIFKKQKKDNLLQEKAPFCKNVIISSVTQDYNDTEYTSVVTKRQIIKVEADKGGITLKVLGDGWMPRTLGSVRDWRVKTTPEAINELIAALEEAKGW